MSEYKYEWLLPEGMHKTLHKIAFACLSFNSRTVAFDSRFSVGERKYNITGLIDYALYLNDIRLCSVVVGDKGHHESYNTNVLTPEIWSNVMADISTVYARTLLVDELEKSKLEDLFSLEMKGAKHASEPSS